MTEAALIDIRNATIFRGDTKVFENLSLIIRQHEPTAILGPNGAGKTTLLKVLNRELYPVSREGSSVRILGRETWNVWELRSSIGIVSHDLLDGFRHSSCGLDVVLSGYLSGIGIHGSLSGKITDEQAENAKSIMRELGVDFLVDTPLGNMSTGQQRRGNSVAVCWRGRSFTIRTH